MLKTKAADFSDSKMRTLLTGETDSSLYEMYNYLLDNVDSQYVNRTN
jgi:hypothetical protein